MKYVALLRGINVGGNAKVDMKDLKALFEGLDLENVKTYINSGNVIFDSKLDQKNLQADIQKAIKQKFHLDISVIIKSLTEIRSISKIIPISWVNDQEMKTDVLFLWEEIDSKDILTTIGIKEDIENAIYTKGAVVWNINRKNVTKSRVLKLVGTDLYKKMTIRNINTLRKLEVLMQ